MEVVGHWFDCAASLADEALDAVDDGDDDHFPDWRWTSLIQVNCRTSDCVVIVVVICVSGPVDLEHPY